MSTPLRERMINTLRVGHYSERTIHTYIGWLIRLAGHYHRSPAELGSEQVQAFLLHLSEAEKLAWSTVNQALAACRFFYGKVLYRPRPAVARLDQKSRQSSFIVMNPNRIQPGNEKRERPASCDPLVSRREKTPLFRTSKKITLQSGTPDQPTSSKEQEKIIKISWR